MSEENDILKASLSHYNFEAAKRKAIKEEEVYESYMPPNPKFTKVEIKKDSAWWLMFFKNVLLEFRM